MIEYRQYLHSQYPYFRIDRQTETFEYKHSGWGSKWKAHTLGGWDSILYSRLTVRVSLLYIVLRTGSN